MLRASYLFLFCLLFAPAATAAAAPAAAAPADAGEEFLAALARVDAGDTGAADSETLRTYLLYPYVQALRLRAALARARGEELDGAIAAFLREQPALPPARELRRAWMHSLAERAQWPLFLAQYQETGDAALRCHRLSAWLETGGSDNLKAEALQIWMSGQQLAQACTRPFQWLQEQGELTAERKEQRARLALAAGNAELAEWLLLSAEPARAAPLQQWIRLLRQPKAELRVLASRPELAVEWTPLRDAFIKVSRGAAADVQELLPQLLQRPLEPAQSDELRHQLALALAWERRPEALAAFRELPDAALDARGHEWRVRSALRHGDWPQALDWLQRMPAELAAQPRWTYWRARALIAAGQAEPGLQAYRSLLPANGYYALLAALRLGQPYQAQSTPAPDDPKLQRQLAESLHAQRARELLRLGRIEWANSEWNLLTADLDAAQWQQAARLAAGWGWTLQAAAAWKRSGAPDDLALLYPQPYQKEMQAAASAAGLPADWLYAIARQESLFLPQARSRSDALGLMQVKLDTARHVARRARQPLPQREDLFDPAINSRYGGAYLAEVLQRFDGHLALAFGAYNAGPGAVARWLTEQPVEADVWIENVPFNETRDYVQKVLWNAALYSARSSGRPPEAAAWLGPIRAPAPKPRP